MKDLNKLIPVGSGWELQQAYGINNAGQIVGTGTHKGLEHGFLLTPQ
jgi:probable HAF family extracellular repeat protein